MSQLLKQIEKEARSIRDKILKRQKPSMRFPLRNLSNVRFDPKMGYFEMGRKTSKYKTYKFPERKAFTGLLQQFGSEPTAADVAAE